MIGFIDRASPLGQQYLRHQSEDVFYREAKFHSADEVAARLASNGFTISAWAQTLTRPLGQSQQIEPMQAGHGQGGFVVVAANARP